MKKAAKSKVSSNGRVVGKIDGYSIGSVLRRLGKECYMLNYTGQPHGLIPAGAGAMYVELKAVLNGL